jgi:hypothetical protein
VIPDRYDPWRRLLAAVLLRAVWDVHTPTQGLSQQDYASAIAFLGDRHVKYLLEGMGVCLPWTKVYEFVEGKQAS